MSQIDNGTAYPELTTPAASDVLLGYRPAGADPMNHIVSSKLNVNTVNGQSLQALATGLIKNTTATGVPVIATPGTDYTTPANVTTSVTSLTASVAEATVASATTADIGAATANRVQITGTITITGLGTTANVIRLVRFAGALTLTHNATSLILPGAASITTAAGDTMIVSSDGSGNWRCLSYQRASGLAVVGTTVNTAQLCKAWVNFNGTGTVAIRDQFNVSSITDNGVGDYTVNFTSALSNTNYCPVFGCNDFGWADSGDSNVALYGQNSTPAALSTGSMRLQTVAEQAGRAPRDPLFVFAAIFSN